MSSVPEWSLTSKAWGSKQLMDIDYWYQLVIINIWLYLNRFLKEIIFIIQVERYLKVDFEEFTPSNPIWEGNEVDELNKADSEFTVIEAEWWNYMDLVFYSLKS